MSLMNSDFPFKSASVHTVNIWLVPQEKLTFSLICRKKKTHGILEHIGGKPSFYIMMSYMKVHLRHGCHCKENLDKLRVQENVLRRLSDLISKFFLKKKERNSGNFYKN